MYLIDDQTKYRDIIRAIFKVRDQANPYDDDDLDSREFNYREGVHSILNAAVARFPESDDFPFKRSLVQLYVALDQQRSWNSYGDDDRDMEESGREIGFYLLIDLYTGFCSECGTPYDFSNITKHQGYFMTCEHCVQAQGELWAEDESAS